MASLLSRTATTAASRLSASRFTFSISSRTMASYLVNDPKYSFLKELGLQEQNKGVFDGTWHGSGEVKSVYLGFPKHVFKLAVFYRSSPPFALPMGSRLLK